MGSRLYSVLHRTGAISMITGTADSDTPSMYTNFVVWLLLIFGMLKENNYHLYIKQIMLTTLLYIVPEQIWCCVYNVMCSTCARISSTSISQFLDIER